MALPAVAIIGRPNVGKSSLLNALAGEMISIVEPTAGVTRDRVTAVIEVENDRYVEFIDTGGYGIVDSDLLSEHIEGQIRKAISSAQLVVFMVDIRDGLAVLDKTIAALLRKNNLKVVLTANKADSPKQYPLASEFLPLGFGPPICISAANNVNKAELVEKIAEELNHIPAEAFLEPAMKIALVGKRNAGKSTMLNSIVGDERVIVSEIPGTTRDAVDVRFEKDGKTFLAIDTAGVRKKGKMANSIEFYSYTRATKSIKRADVVLFLIDSTLKISQVDKKLANFIASEYKACILVINKWDLAKDRATTDDYADYLDKVLPAMRYAPIAFTTATDGKNVQSVLDLASELYKQASAKLSTSLLNKAVEEISKEHLSTPRKKHGKPKIFYATQVSALPVTLLFFVNRPDLFDAQFRRFILNKLRDLLPVTEVPIRLLFRKRH